MRLTILLAALGLAACSSTHVADGDGGPDPSGYDECALPSDCLLLPASCCGSCGAATRGDSVAVHVDRAAAYQADACGDETGCPGCFMEQDPTLIATCDAGRCRVVDLLADPATECAEDTDCRLRANACCECGASVTPTNVLSVSDAAAVEALLCDPGTGCPECAPVYPETVSAGCEAGRCVVNAL